MKCNIDIKAREVVHALRSEILKARKTPLPENLTIKDILEVQVPAFTLYVDLIFDEQNQQINSEELNQLVKTRLLQ